MRKLRVASSFAQQERAVDQVRLENGNSIRISWTRSVPTYGYTNQDPQLGSWKWTAFLSNMENVKFSGWQHQRDERNVQNVIDEMSERLDILLSVVSPY